MAVQLGEPVHEKKNSSDKSKQSINLKKALFRVCITAVLAFLVSLFKCRIQTTAIGWYGELFPLTQVHIYVLVGFSFCNVLKRNFSGLEGDMTRHHSRVSLMSV